MSDNERLLEQVARAITQKIEPNMEGELLKENMAILLPVLRAKLLPLLEAGQAMRQVWGPKTKNHLPINWDAAKQLPTTGEPNDPCTFTVVRIEPSNDPFSQEALVHDAMCWRMREPAKQRRSNSEKQPKTY
jgi:hypothetical protein